MSIISFLFWVGGAVAFDMRGLGFWRALGWPYYLGKQVANWTADKTEARHD